MTVLTSESSVLGTAVRLPRVNLLPPEIAEQRKARRIQAGLGLVALSSVALVGGLYLMANHSVSAAQSDLAAAEQQTAQLKAETAKYAGVTATIAATEAAQAQLVTAMGDEVRYSQLLTDISLAIPGNVWLKTLVFAPAQVRPGGAAAPGAGPVGSSVPVSGAATSVTPVATPIGTLTVTGVGFEHDDLALWLEAIAKLDKTYANPYFSTSTKALIGERPIVNFTATADLLSSAQSGRYTTPAGG